MENSSVHQLGISNLTVILSFNVLGNTLSLMVLISCGLDDRILGLSFEVLGVDLGISCL